MVERQLPKLHTWVRFPSPAPNNKQTGISLDHNSQIDMRMFARNAGTTMTFQPGSLVFKEGDSGNCVYIIHSGR